MKKSNVNKTSQNPQQNKKITNEISAKNSGESKELVTSLEKFSNLGGFNSIFINHIVPLLTDPKDVLRVSHSCAFFRRNMPPQQLTRAIECLKQNITAFLDHLDKRNFPAETLPIKAVIVPVGKNIPIRKMMTDFARPKCDTSAYKSVIGVDFLLKDIELLESTFFVQLWDIYSELYSHITKVYVKNTNILYIVCDNPLVSSGRIKGWVDCVKENSSNNLTIALLIIRNLSMMHKDEENNEKWQQEMQELGISQFTYVDPENIRNIVRAFNQGIATHLDRLYPVQNAAPAQNIFSVIKEKSSCLIM